jgi:hypothetical protein
MNTTTGDPTIDSLLTWMSNGGKLQSTGAILAIGMAIKSVCIPIICRISKRFSLKFSGANKLHAVGACGILIVGVINLVTRQHLTFSDVVVMGVQAGVVAVGIHESLAALAPTVAVDNERELKAIAEAGK